MEGRTEGAATRAEERASVGVFGAVQCDLIYLLKR